jgi:hypothetical protein
MREAEITQAQIEAHLPFACLMGAAGTGKTTLARQLVEARQDALLCATTGIAAVNLGDASTINSTLGYFDTASLQSSYASGFLQTRLRRLRRAGITLLVLDEVSMLDADQLTILSLAMSQIEMSRGYDEDLEGRQFETMGLLLVGDFAQLPPVKAPFVFESPEWGRFADHVLTLRTPWRQGEDAYVTALQAVRKGQSRAALEVLEPRMVSTLDMHFSGTTIVAKNDEVDRINALRYAGLPGTPIAWAVTRSGEQTREWTRLIPEQVVVKPGALVMLLANRPYPRDEDDPIASYRYVNGDLATVLDRDAGGVRVQVHRTGIEQTVLPVTREWKEPTGDRKNPWTVLGSVTHLPMRLAYASTVHKIQGLSLDEIQVSLASWMFAKPGMVYVALSRCRTLGGLRIVGNAQQFARKCTVDGRVRAWL